MNPTMQKYKKEYAPELLRIARGDLASAEALSQVQVGRKENVVYLAEQAIEKCLKAVLCHLEKAIIHTHDLDVLATLLPDTHKPPQAHQLGSLTQYATIRRYVEGFEILDPADLQQAIQLGHKILIWAEGKIR